MLNQNKRKLDKIKRYNRVLQLLTNPMSQNELALADGKNKRREYYWWAITDLLNEGYIRIVARGNMNSKIFQTVRYNYGASFDLSTEPTKEQIRRMKAEKNRVEKLAKEQSSGIRRLTDTVHWTPKAKQHLEVRRGSTLGSMTF